MIRNLGRSGIFMPPVLFWLPVTFSPDQLLQPECVSAEPTESIPPQCLHGSRAMQPDFVWLSWPLPAQKSRQRSLLASEPSDSHHHQSERQAEGHGPARRGRKDEISNRVWLPVLQWLWRRGLWEVKSSIWSPPPISAAVCDLTDYLSAALLNTPNIL